MCRMLCVWLLRLVCSFTKTSPLRSSCRLLACMNPSKLDSVTADSLLDVVAVFFSRLSPAFAGSNLLTTTGSSATSHHVSALLGYSYSVVTSFSRFAYGRANAAWMMPGFPSYCAGSLSVDTSPITCCSCFCIELRVFLHAHSCNQPNRVHLRYVPSNFLSLPSDPSVGR